jgi:hypothetical protein
MMGSCKQPRTPPRTPKRLERSEAWQSQKKPPCNTNLTVFALWLGGCLNSQEFIAFGTKAPAASSSADLHCACTINRWMDWQAWEGRRANQVYKKPENGSKRSSETRLVQIQRPTTQISQRGQVIVENCSPDNHLANVYPLLHLSIIPDVTVCGEN